MVQKRRKFDAILLSNDTIGPPCSPRGSISHHIINPIKRTYTCTFYNDLMPYIKQRLCLIQLINNNYGE
jgi:hypothetical protein